MSHRIVLEKETFKFSVAHFTILSADTAERLHGHNYYASVELRLKSVKDDIGMAFDFNDVKPLVKAIANRLDEYVLIPQRSPYLKIEKTTSTETGESIRVQFGKKIYVFPAEDVVALPLVNITSEELARYFAQQLLDSLRSKPDAISKVRSLSVGIQETRGQAVYHELEFN